MNTNPYQTDEDVVAQYEALRADAISYTIEACWKAFPQMSARFGEQGRQRCAEDVAFHLDFLRPALVTGDITPFIAYLAWLVQVLTTRGVPVQAVPQSLQDLGVFFEKHLGAQAMPIVAALAAGKDALAVGISAPYQVVGPEKWEEADSYSTAALLGKHDDAVSLLEDAFARRDSLPGVAVHVIQPAMYEVGRLWQRNQVSVAQEHLATATSESWIAQGMPRSKAAPDNGKRAVFACLAGNHHGLGLRMVADAFELDGWAVDHLGTNIPVEALVTQVRDTRPHLVGFSATLPQHLLGLRLAIGQMRQTLGEACPRIAIGGLAINQFPGLAQWVGAEVLGTDALAAVAAAAEAHPSDPR